MKRRIMIYKERIKRHKKDILNAQYNMLIREFYCDILRIIFKMQSSKNKVRVLEEEWDNMIILDACRSDYFKKAYKEFLNGKLEKRLSLGSHTTEWLEKNFNKKEDIVYISSNPFINNTGNIEEPWNKNFYKIISLWNLKWKGNLDSVHPRDVVKMANKVDKRYPNKRKIIHFIQPHLPYLNKSKKFNKEVFKKSRDGRLSERDIKEMKRSYKENIKTVLRHLMRLDLRGKTVITSDHGELFGEYGLFLHCRGIYFKELIEVPWLIIKEKRKSKMMDRVSNIRI